MPKLYYPAILYKLSVVSGDHIKMASSLHREIRGNALFSYFF